MVVTMKILVLGLLLLPGLAMGQMSFVVADPVDGHPLLINGGLGDMDRDGMEAAILVSEGNVSDMYIAPGLARLSGPSFLKDGVYHVKLFSHYHREEFCKYSASDQLRAEYVSLCRRVGYRACDFSVDTHQRKFQFGVPWPCLFLDTDGAPLMGISKPGFLPQGWVSFDSLAKTKNQDFLKVVDAITAIVRKMAESRR
jgi:hypothetical protein